MKWGQYFAGDIFTWRGTDMSLRHPGERNRNGRAGNELKVRLYVHVYIYMQISSACSL